MENNKKIIESRKVEDFEIWTDEGWVDIQEVHKTVKFDVWLLETESFQLQCADEHIIIGENRQEIFAKDLKIGDKILTENGLENVLKVQKLDIEPENMYDFSIDSENHTFFSNGILSHNTTIATIFCLWVAIFNEDKSILLVANKEKTAAEIIKRIKLAYEEIPNWLKAGVGEWAKESLVLSNNSRIEISTTTGTAARGKSADLLFIDEADWIEAGMLKEFWASVFPIISSKKKSKIIMASTPRDTSGLFYKLYDGSVKGENEWANLKIKWDEIPGRDEKWKQQILGSLGDPELFNREFNCEFDNVGDAEIDMDTFELLKRECMLPLYSLEEECYKIWENADETKLYVAGVDVAEGIGRDYTVIQILDITDIRQIKQVAVYANNRISPIEFTPKLREILKDWGDPLVLIEANNCGSVPVNNLKKDFSYENIVNWGVSKVGNAYDRQKLGVVSHTNTKFLGVKNMKYFINTMKRVKIYDTVTVNELKDFVKNKSGTYSAKHGAHDDRVMALVWALMILHTDLVGRYFDVQEYDEHQQVLHIKPIDFGINYFMNPSSIYDKAKGGGDALPLFISEMREPSNMELDDLYIDGWNPLGN